MRGPSSPIGRNSASGNTARSFCSGCSIARTAIRSSSPKRGGSISGRGKDFILVRPARTLHELTAALHHRMSVDHLERECDIEERLQKPLRRHDAIVGLSVAIVVGTVAVFADS